MHDKHDKIEKWFFIGVPIIILSTFLFHSLYELTNHNYLIGLIFPHNESIFAHMKLVLWPIPLYFFIVYLFKKEDIISKDQYFTSVLVALLVSLLTIPFLYYFYTGAFGFESRIIDISIGILAVIFGMLSSLCVYKKCAGINYLIAIGFIIFIFLGFAILTIKPLNIPIFQDNQFTK